MGILRRLFQFFAWTKRIISPTPDHWDTDTVLVGSLRNREQLDICLGCNFYHIPAVMLAPEDFPIAYIAIYQSRHFFGRKAAIRYYGKVTDSKLLHRYEITEIPREDDTLYYRFQIETWQTLPKPIQAKEMPASHLLTNRYLLFHSATTSHLTMKSQDAFRQFCELLSLVTKGRSCSIALGKLSLSLSRGNISYETANAKQTIPRQAFLDRPAMYFHQIKNRPD